MKKLMILGGARYILPVIEKAHEMGIYVITCDYLPDNVAHKYSDEYMNISIVNKEAVLEGAKKANIDGIMSFACDPGVATAAYVAEKMGLPFAGSYEAVSILQNKDKFRAFLEKNGFTVPASGGYRTVEDALNDTEKFTFPVIVKPVDSAGSKGVSRVDDVKDLKKAAEFALKFSIDGRFIVEDFIEKKGFSSDSDSFTVDGKFQFLSFSDQRFDENASNPYTPAAYSWPPTMEEDAQKELADELQRLSDLLGLKTSVYNIETRVGTNGKPYIMEVSPRGGGNRLSEMLYHVTDVDLIENAVRAAVGEPLVDMRQKPYNGYLAEIILHSEKEGIFRELWMNEEIRENVLEEDLWVKDGDRVSGFSGANEAIGTLVLKFDNREKMEDVLKKQNEYLKVILK